jgi:uncharacterized protein YndB with AHSA1/START domain/DNA-binding transcriptional ArsR family regulator
MQRKGLVHRPEAPVKPLPTVVPDRSRAPQGSHQRTGSPGREWGLIVTSQAQTIREVDEDLVFRALSDPHRRTLLDLLHEHDGMTLGELDAHLQMTRFGTMKHLRMLESAGLLVARRAGRRKLHYLNAQPIRAIHDRWIGQYAHPEAPGAHGPAQGTNGSRPEPLQLAPGRPTSGAPRHVCEVFVRARPEQVWEAIVSPEFTRNYFYGTLVSSEWKPGTALTYANVDGRRAAEGVVLEVDPHRRLVHTFSALWDFDVASDRPHRVTWTIQPVGRVCRLVMEHEGFEGETATWRTVSGGASAVLSGLKTLLETGEPLSIGG